MAESGALPGSEDGRRPDTFLAQCQMSHRIDALMDPVQAARFQTPGDSAGPDSRSCELTARGDAVLSRRQLCDRDVSLDLFLPHVARKESTALDSPLRLAMPGRLGSHAHLQVLPAARSNQGRIVKHPTQPARLPL